MNIGQAPHGSGTLRGRLGWLRVMVLAAILAGIFVMHTAGHAADGSTRATPVVHAQHTEGHVQAAHGRQTLHAGQALAVGHPGQAPVVRAAPAEGGHPQHGFGCDISSMCLGLLAGAAVLLVLARARVAGLPRGPSAEPGGPCAPRTAPPRPPSLAVLSVSRT